MLIDTTNGSLYFTIFYSLAFLLAFIVLLWEGYQRKIPVVSWVLLLIFSIVSFIAGTKIFAFSREEWLMMFNQATLIPTSEKFLLGGIFLATIAIVAGKYVLKIKQPVLDAFAFVFPIGIGVQKFGCFFNGCCFGKPTNLPWGIQYTANSLPHNHPFQSGLHGTGEILSLPIHPVQLYEVAALFLAVFIVFRTRKVWKANGSLFVCSMLLYSMVRFITEFFMNVTDQALSGETTVIFNMIQWVMLGSTIMLSFILLYREKIITIKIQPPTQSAIFGINSYLLIFFIESLSIWTLRNWFSPSELIAVLLTFSISSIIIFFWILKEIASSRAKLFYSCLLILPLLITSQTIPPSQSDSTQVIRTKKISFGMTSGNFENSFSRITGSAGDGCGNTYENHYIKQKYTVGGAAYSVKDEYPQKRFSTNYGVNMYLGQNSEQLDSKGTESKTVLYGFNPYIKFDANWFGIGGGIHVGNLVYTSSSITDHGDATKAMEETSVYPQAYLRVGPQKIFYIDYHLGDQFPSPFPCFYQQIGIGSGLGLNDVNFRAGGFITPEIGGYFSAYFPVSKALSLEPMVVLTSSHLNHFSIGVHYNITSVTFYKKTKQN
ncbi:MAG: prolipoprotein diacylglyceryl transferase family protein [Mariniphaga sp.]